MNTGCGRSPYILFASSGEADILTNTDATGGEAANKYPLLAGERASLARRSRLKIFVWHLNLPYVKAQCTGILTTLLACFSIWPVPAVL